MKVYDVEQAINELKSDLAEWDKEGYCAMNPDLVRTLITTIESLQTRNATLERFVEQSNLSDMIGKMNPVLELAKIQEQLVSQKEEIERWSKIYAQERDYSTKFQKERDDLQKEIQSLKAITELAVKENENLKAQLKNADAKELNYDNLRKQFDLAISALSMELDVAIASRFQYSVNRINNSLIEISKLSK